MFFAKLHPLIVHFPVALLTSGVVFEIYGSFKKDEVVETAGRFNTRLGFWCIFPVLAVGFLGMLSLNNTTEFKDFLFNHLRFAFLTASAFIVAMVVSRHFQNKLGRTVYFLALAAGLYCILHTGYYGGELVHRFGVSTGK
ncbi:MAG: hypothetical protein H8E32_11325 [Nitrospinae bacterium]|nr:hypothetical protein [Nitrospinota bacterium]